MHVAMSIARCALEEAEAEAEAEADADIGPSWGRC